MKITTLIEDKSGNKEDLYIEHGLSLYIEVDDKNILLDTGESGKFIDNAKKLDIDLKNLDYVILSHGHYDHSGGLIRLIEEINPDIKLYIGSEFFNEKYNRTSNGGYEYSGNPFDETFLKDNNIDIEYIDKDVTNITQNLSIYANFNRDKEFENINETMLIRDGEGYKKDMFYDEISLGIKTSKGVVALVGCSHAGIVNILKTIDKRTNMDIHAVLGGTHLIKEDDAKISKIIDYFKENAIKVIGACHCTGEQGEMMLKEQMKDNFISNNTGDVLKF